MDRRYVRDMLRLHEYIDMIIPRGGNGLHTFCRENSSIPVITGGIGVCHIFVDAERALGQGNARAATTPKRNDRPSAIPWRRCWCISSVAPQLLPELVDALGAAGVVSSARKHAPAPSLAVTSRVVRCGHRRL